MKTKTHVILRLVILILVSTQVIYSQSGWNRQYSGTSNDLKNTFFTDAQNGVIVGAGGIILKTSDGGEHWNQKTGGTTNNLTFVTFVKFYAPWPFLTQGLTLPLLLHRWQTYVEGRENEGF